jgi:glucokinase
VKQAVLVNGVPASGKTTVARAIGAHLDAPVLGLDVVKEVLFDELGHREADREWGRALGQASIESIWALLANFPAGSTVVVEAWFRLPPFDAVQHGLERAGIDRWVEIWCHADSEVILERYAARDRHPGHPAPEDYADELRQLIAAARPMALEPCLEVNTGNFSTLDLDQVAIWAEKRLSPEIQSAG